jgi:hypothetical protein
MYAGFGSGELSDSGRGGPRFPRDSSRQLPFRAWRSAAVEWDLEELPGTLVGLTALGKATVVLDRHPDDEVSVPIDTVRPCRVVRAGIGSTIGLPNIGE